MKQPGERYMEMRDAQEIGDLRAGRLFRPKEWPDDYIPAPGSNDDVGQRLRFGYLRHDGMWIMMPAPGYHDAVGMSEWYVRHHPVTITQVETQPVILKLEPVFTVVPGSQPKLQKFVFSWWFVLAGAVIGSIVGWIVG